MGLIQQEGLPSVNELEIGDAVFDPATPIWHSQFQDVQWVYLLSDDVRFNGRKSSMIDWKGFKQSSRHHKEKYDYCLTEQMVSELKIASAIYAFYPKLFKHSKTSKTTVDGKTVKGRVRELAKIGSYITREEQKDGFSINSFADISFETFKRHAPHIGGRPDHLRRAMRILTSEIVQRNLPRRLALQSSDIDSKSINWSEQSVHEGIGTLSDAQFIFLLNHCKRAISEFKVAINCEIHDRTIANTARKEIVKKFTNVRLPLEYYVWGGGRDEENLQQKYKKEYGYTPGEVRNLYNEAHKASMLIILLLTGMRFSEAQLIRRGALAYADGIRYIVSKVVKRRHEGAPAVDRWIAIPLVEDAHDILNYACEQSGNEYLFSSPTEVVREGGQGYSNLNTTFIRWIKKIDHQGLFNGYKFSVHQCRETLTHQLAKHEVGLPFISKQLKHFHSRFKRMPNEVTAGYGGYKRDLQLSIESRMAIAREEVLTDLFGADKKFAGGGGAQHKYRIDAWFKGAGLFGEQRAKYISRLANSNISLMPTSIGVCTHNFVEKDNGQETPPCYGDFSCDPDCPNHVISEGCSSALKDRQMHAEEKAGESPEQAIIWVGLAEQLGKHVKKFEGGMRDD
ncbi:hypothetical protein KEHDKFFH_17005 [Marinobacter maroccanus]|uniref:Tyr recombinase domain-containing protein n=1 Tax=Marinobacter maroccanus TaxID=2055143 RepID=A0A2S5Z6G6_9GAMM|nr:site-specific integrase [Marinobacter maroccanus]PPI82985.1 hypothetical protein KEHDKFFH_17005 [Marinobacter maroccanus]